MDMEQRRERINELADSVCRGARFEAADKHVASIRAVERITGVPMTTSPWQDFLAGWDAAMESECEHLAEENKDLHGMVIDLCQRLAIRRCDKCRGLGVDNRLEPCGCDGGWVDAPAGEAERVIEAVKQTKP
jgi:hypothetical protein